MRAILLLLLCSFMLAGCAETGSSGYYGDRGYYGGGSRGGYYGDDDAYDRRHRRVEVNCNMNWQNCASVCNQIHNANERAVCVANCNNALNQCKSQY